MGGAMGASLLGGISQGMVLGQEQKLKKQQQDVQAEYMKAQKRMLAAQADAEEKKQMFLTQLQTSDPEAYARVMTGEKIPGELQVLRELQKLSTGSSTPQAQHGAVAPQQAAPVAGPSDKIASALRPHAAPEQYRDLAKYWADYHGVDPSVMMNNTAVESSWNPDAVGPPTRTGERAIGISQLMSGTAKRYNVDNPRNPNQALRAQANYLADLYKEFSSDPKYAGKDPWKLAVAAYNAGEEAVRKYGDIPPYKETQNHVRKVWNAPGLMMGGAPVNIGAGGSRPASVSTPGGDLSYPEMYRAYIKKMFGISPDEYSAHTTNGVTVLTNKKDPTDIRYVPAPQEPVQVEYYDPVSKETKMRWEFKPVDPRFFPQSRGQSGSPADQNPVAPQSTSPPGGTTAPQASADRIVKPAPPPKEATYIETGTNAEYRYLVDSTTGKPIPGSAVLVKEGKDPEMEYTQKAEYALQALEQVKRLQDAIGTFDMGTWKGVGNRAKMLIGPGGMTGKIPGISGKLEFDVMRDSIEQLSDLISRPEFQTGMNKEQAKAFVESRMPNPEADSAAVAKEKLTSLARYLWAQVNTDQPPAFAEDRLKKLGYEELISKKGPPERKTLAPAPDIFPKGEKKSLGPVSEQFKPIQPVTQATLPIANPQAIRAITYGLPDGTEAVLQTIAPDGRVMTDEQAVNVFKKSGKHLGIFKNSDEAARFVSLMGFVDGSSEGDEE